MTIKKMKINPNLSLPVEKKECDTKAEPDANEGQFLHRTRKQVIDNFNSYLRR
jgi:hypothetical protein